MTKKLNFISLFSGGGGFQIGFENAWYNCLLSSDIDGDAEKTHHKNYPEIPFIKIKGTKTATSTIVVAMIAKDTCLAPL